MTLRDLQPFSAALQFNRGRQVMPTNLNTAQLQQLDAAVRRGSFFSAETMFADYLDSLKADVERIVNPTTGAREDGSPRTEGTDQASARLNAKDLLKRIGYSPEEGEAGTIKDLSSDTRINLVLKTNVQVAQGAGQFIQSQSEQVIVAFPCWELFRLSEPRDPRAKRNWNSRWLIAGRAAGDFDAIRVFEQTGRMVARKDSPIWQLLGSSDLFDDGLDNPFPPFAFNSGMDVKDISYSESLSLGIIKRGDKITPMLPDDLGKLFKEAA